MVCTRLLLMTLRTSDANYRVLLMLLGVLKLIWDLGPVQELFVPVPAHL